MVCPRYQIQEDWEHIIKCEILRDKRKDFIVKLHNKLHKDVIFEDLKEPIMDILSDIVEYFKGKNNFKITQSIISMNFLFRGMIVRDWKNNSDMNKY